LLPLEWSDELRVAPSEGLALSCSDPALPTDASNLVVRAALALAHHAGIEPRGAIHLEKRIPYGAGLGGGSSDAATALLLLSDLWGLAVSSDELHGLASSLGADVPFFLAGRPAIGTGRGDVLSPLLDAEGRPYRIPFPVVVAVPAARVPTPAAYALVAPDHRPRPDLAAAILSNDMERWRREIENDFQGPVVAHYPGVGDALALLRDAGAEYTSLSGSGSAVFGIFATEASAREAADAVRGGGLTVWTQ
jgi:4-diphosphocytidyl-2-C-methyl-D-erythritol kinase